ncbi:MAG: hypothetical protein NT154_33540 [Verrucomicrobia bacterium]|nr:hypothetical protein [Verrucomicrobiota bacterium]
MKPNAHAVAMILHAIRVLTVTKDTAFALLLLSFTLNAALAQPVRVATNRISPTVKQPATVALRKAAVFDPKVV